MVLEDWVELDDIRTRLMFEVSLQDVKEQWPRAKKIFVDRYSYLEINDFGVLLSIFEKGIEVVGKFCKNWKKNTFSPTDEELDLLEELFDEGSWIFNKLSNDPPHYFSSQGNRVKQQLIQTNKRIIAEERQKRRNPTPTPTPTPTPNQSTQSNTLSTFLKEKGVLFFFFFFVVIIFLAITVIAYKLKKSKTH